MKRIFSALLCVLFAAMMIVSANAATGINENEQRVLDLLRGEDKLASGATVIIPVNYVNQAENFFLQIDMTAEQADEIIGYVQAAIDLLNSRSFKVNGSEFNLKNLEYADKKALLNYGQLACKVIGLNLTYDGTNIVITDANDSSKLYFSNAPIIKVTGESMAFGAGAAVIVLAAGVYVFMRKRIAA